MEVLRGEEDFELHSLCWQPVAIYDKRRLDVEQIVVAFISSDELPNTKDFIRKAALDPRAYVLSEDEIFRKKITTQQMHSQRICWSAITDRADQINEKGISSTRIVKCPSGFRGAFFILHIITAYCRRLILLI